MKPWSRRLIAAGLFAASAWTASAQEASVPPPARNWALPLFTKEGFRQMMLRGDEVHPVSANQIDIHGMNVTVFSGTADAKVDTVLLSPDATFLLSEKIARGPGDVRVIRDDLDVTGKGWTYFYDQKKVLITHNAHVVFHAQMPDILR